MKIPVKESTYAQVMALPRPAHHLPRRPLLPLRLIMRLAAWKELHDTHFTYTSSLKEGDTQPALILMNHSSWIDLLMCTEIFKDRPYCIVCTSDGFVGKRLLMELMGCIPTQKFVTDFALLSDMAHALKKLRCSVLLYPEASYSFDGTATPLPRRMGLLLKKLDVPVLMVKTEGAFARDPLYNCLQKRQVDVSAHVETLLTREDIKTKSVAELDEALTSAFTFDNFRWQQEKGIEIHEPFRADGLHRILYKCAACGAEGHMEGKGDTLTCHACGKSYTLTPLGQLQAKGGNTEFAHIPDWYNWERQQVKKELEEGSYLLDTPVKIGMMVDYNSIYMVGEGHLRHDTEGFTLTGCDGQLTYTQTAKACYGLYADYFWYELGDIICIGNQEHLFYCFPAADVPVAKARLATEELYKLKKGK